MDRLVASKAATDHFTRTRWWWIRHAPVRVDEGRIYGQRDLPCDCSEAGVFASLAALLPQDAIWVTSHLSRTVQTAQAIQAAGHFTSPEIHQDKDFAEQHLGDWQGLDRQSFLLGRQQSRIRSGTPPRTSARRTAKVLSTSSSGSARASRG